MNEPKKEIIENLISAIYHLQSKGEKYFPSGLFPSFRNNKYLLYKRPDTNVFYTATIVFILQNIKPYLSEKYKKIIDEISDKAIKNYPNFQNKDGLKTYNFWQTKPSKHFSNGFIFKHLEHFRIPDDIDDTALVYLTLPHQREEVLWLKEKLKTHANLEKIQIRNTFSHYRNLKVYSTWFGKNMPIEFDVCALCNLMYLFEKYQIPPNEYDKDTFRFLGEVIERDEFIKNPFLVSHNYASTPLIIYHYARLLGDFSIEALEHCRAKLIKTSLQLLDNEAITMNRIILETSLLKLGHEPKSKNVFNEIYTSDFRYFIAGLLSSYENPILQKFAPLKITQMQWHCEAHNKALLLENFVWKFKKNNPLI